MVTAARPKKTTEPPHTVARNLLPNPDLPLRHQHELTLLTLCVYHEARGETASGRSAVAWVVLNRWRKQGWYGKTVRDIVLYPRQFSPFNDPANLLDIRDLAAWDRCYEAASDAYFGLGADPTGGADHFCRHDVFPAWKSHPKTKQIKQIGKHVFYIVP